jgi:GTPase
MGRKGKRRAFNGQRNLCFQYLCTPLMKVGFVNIFGKPNAGKSTLLNALMGEKLAIVSHKVQTTRHRIKGILSGKDYQIVISDTPGIIEPKYKLHEKMMQAVKNSLEDADLALFLIDIRDDWQENENLFQSLSIKSPVFLVLNKSDLADESKKEQARAYFNTKKGFKDIFFISALRKEQTNYLLNSILDYLPEGQPFYDGDEYTDLPVKFLAAEIIREKIFNLYEEEIPYHTTVLVQEFVEKPNIVKIRADIIVQRETQKAIILGEKGKMIKRLGIESRQDIESLIGQKIFLELFVKVREKWRDSELFLKEYGY